MGLKEQSISICGENGNIGRMLGQVQLRELNSQGLQTVNPSQRHIYSLYSQVLAWLRFFHPNSSNPGQRRAVIFSQNHAVFGNNPTHVSLGKDRHLATLLNRDLEVRSEERRVGKRVDRTGRQTRR